MIVQWLNLVAHVHAVRLALQGCGDRFPAPVASWSLAAIPDDVLKLFVESKVVIYHYQSTVQRLSIKARVLVTLTFSTLIKEQELLCVQHPHREQGSQELVSFRICS